MNDHHSVGGNPGGEQNPAYGFLRPQLSSMTENPTAMPRPLSFSPPLWEKIVAQTTDELAALPRPDRQWLETQLAAIRDGQVAIDLLVQAVDGAASCAACPERCCGCGRHHFTLTNLLASLAQGETPPAPDATATCPFLGDQGCLLPAAQRPYNCITFICARIEDRLGMAGRQTFYRLDSRLRAAYQAVADRYPAASLRGLLIALQRHDDGPLLQPRALGSKLASRNF